MKKGISRCQLCNYLAFLLCFSIFLDYFYKFSWASIILVQHVYDYFRLSLDSLYKLSLKCFEGLISQMEKLEAGNTIVKY